MSEKNNFLTAGNINNIIENEITNRLSFEALSINSNSNRSRLSSNGEGKSTTFNNITTTLGNLIHGRRASQANFSSRPDDTIEVNINDFEEKFASNVAISPDGQYVVTFNYSKLILF